MRANSRGVKRMLSWCLRVSSLRGRGMLKFRSRARAFAPSPGRRPGPCRLPPATEFLLAKTQLAPALSRLSKSVHAENLFARGLIGVESLTKRHGEREAADGFASGSIQRKNVHEFSCSDRAVCDGAPSATCR